MDKAQLKQKILDVFKGMSEGELIAIYQEGCEHFDCFDDMAFPMDVFDEREGDELTFSDIYRSLGEDFDLDDDYYYIDRDGRYRSFNSIKGNGHGDNYCACVLDELIDYAIDDEYDFGNPKIAEVFEEVRSGENE